MKTADLDIKKLGESDHDIEEKTEVNIDISEYDISSAYLETEEDLTEKVIGYIEKEVRGSYEYGKYISYLKNELDLTKCSLLPNIDCSDGAASLEFHHYPLNLYEITEAVGKEMIDELSDNETVSCFDIAERVMEEHYKGNIGLVPLTKSLHKMAHNKAIIIPISKVNGNYKSFVSKYNNFIDIDIKDRIFDAELNSESDDSKIYNDSKLKKNIMNYNINYAKKEDDDEEEIS